MTSYLDMKMLIAAEYHIDVSDDTPLYEIQYKAAKAEARRNDRLKAAENGKIYVG